MKNRIEKKYDLGVKVPLRPNSRITPEELNILDGIILRQDGLSWMDFTDEMEAEYNWRLEQLKSLNRAGKFYFHDERDHEYQMAHAQELAYDCWGDPIPVDCIPEGEEDKYVYDADGYDQNGYDINGYDRGGYDEYGYNPDGFDRDGYDKDGYDKDGYDRSGYDIGGLDRNMHPRHECHEYTEDICSGYSHDDDDDDDDDDRDRFEELLEKSNNYNASYDEELELDRMSCGMFYH